MANLPSGLNTAWTAAVRRVMDSYWFGRPVADIAVPPVALNNEWVTAVNAAGTGTVNLIKADGSNVVSVGPLNLSRPGVIPINLSASRVLSTNAIVNLAGVGGILAADSDPIMERTNGATDKSIRISWASASTAELQLPPIAWPADLDASAVVTVKCMAAMKAASVNTPVLTIGAFEGVGGTNLGGNTAALSTTLAVVSKTLTVTGYPGFLSLNILPGAHATSSNDVYLYAIWIEYTRK